MKRKQKQYKSTTTTQDITWFTLRVGATSTELRFYSTFHKTTVPIYALSYRSFPSSLAAHLAAVTFLQKSFAHTATEVVHAHSWDLTLKTEIDLTSHHMILMSLDTLDIFT